MEERNVAVIKQSIDWCYRIRWTWGHPFLWMGLVNYETVRVANYFQLWLCIMLGWSDHCLPIMGSQQAAVLSLSTGTSSHLSDEFWQKYTLCYSFCNIYHSSLIKQQGTDLICFDCHTLTITKKNLSEICRETFLCKLSEMFRVWFGSYSNSGCTITILKADAEEINYCTTKQGIFRWALLWMCALCLFLPCSINPKS